MTGAELVDLARRVRARAYAPYSRYAVGAALLTRDGRVYTGVNVENASYALTVCAERVAVIRMVAEGGSGPAMLAVATRDGGFPCGACCQVLAEFSADLPVWIAGDAGPLVETSLAALLPHPFRRQNPPGPSG